MISTPRRLTSSTTIFERSLSARTTLPCTSVRWTLFNCSHSCWQSPSSCCTVYHFTQTLFLITVHHNVFAAPSKNSSRSSNCASLRCTRLSQTFLRAVQHPPGSRLLHPVDCSCLLHSQSMQLQHLPFVGVVGTSRTLRHVPHLESCVACPVPLVRDPLVHCHFSYWFFSFALMLASLEVSQFSSHHFPTRVSTSRRLPTVHLLASSMHTTLRVSLFPARDIVTLPLPFGCV